MHRKKKVESIRNYNPEIFLHSAATTKFVEKKYELAKPSLNRRLREEKEYGKLDDGQCWCAQNLGRCVSPKLVIG